MSKPRVILAIDPGNTESGWAQIQMPEFMLLEFGKWENNKLLEELPRLAKVDQVCIEMVASYGMAVGKDVFETCVWIGRFIQAIHPQKYTYIYRKDEKTTLCGTMKAKDSNIRQALIDRYAVFDFKSGKGTKKNPDTFYGVSKDVWQAIAIGVTHYEMEQEKWEKEKN